MADDTRQGEETLGQDVRNIIGGVVTLVAIIVPVLLIRKIVKSIEDGKTFQSLTDTLRK